MRASHRLRLRLLMTATAVLALASLLGGVAGCGGATADTTPTPTRTPQTQPLLAPTLPPPTPTWTAAPTPTLSPYVNPLTGERVDDPTVLERVPVAVKIDNWPPDQVWPQSGINSADLIFEHYNEGRLSTRWTAIFLDTDPERVGNIRSGRLIDLELPAIYKAVLAAYGFSPFVLPIVRESDLYPNRIVSTSLGETLDPNPFFTDPNDFAPFDKYTNPSRVRTWAEAHGVVGRQNLEGMVFSEEPPAEGEPATYIYIPWRQLDTEWRYDEATGLYLRWSDGLPHVDALDGLQLSAANVVVLYVPQWDVPELIEDLENNIPTIQFALWDSNRAIILRDGVSMEAFWQRWEREDMLTLTDEEANPIALKAGSTFFEVVPVGDREIEIVIEP